MYKTKQIYFYRKASFFKKESFKNFLKFEKIFVGYNRIFYKNINYLKKNLHKKKNINVIVKCPEISPKNITKNSCHIISILTFIFGNLNLKIVTKDKNYINCILFNKNCFCYITFNFKNSDNFSIEIFDDKKKYVLSPIENMKIFNKIKVKKTNNNFLYFPLISKHFCEKKNNIKPGFEAQLKAFIRFTKGYKIINDILFSKKIVEICDKISR